LGNVELLLGNIGDIYTGAAYGSNHTSLSVDKITAIAAANSLNRKLIALYTALHDIRLPISINQTESPPTSARLYWAGGASNGQWQIPVGEHLPSTDCACSIQNFRLDARRHNKPNGAWCKPSVDDVLKWWTWEPT